MSDTDETAIPVNDAFLQRLIQLWLFIPDAIAEIEMLDYDQEYERATDLIAKLKALTTEVEDGK